MNRPGLLWFWMGVLLSACFAGLLFFAVTKKIGPTSDAEKGSFAYTVDLTALDRAAVYHEGRLKSFDSFATEMLSTVSGRSRVRNQPPDFTYLDMIFRPEAYEAEPIIYVKNKGMRLQLAIALENDGVMTPEERTTFISKGMIDEPRLQSPQVSELFNRWAADVVRTAKHVDAVQRARELRRPEVLLSLLRMIAPPSARVDAPWLSLEELWGSGGTMEMHGGGALAAMDPDLLAQMRKTVSDLGVAWRAQNAADTTIAVERLATLLQLVAPEIYPERARMELQSWYFRASNMTWVWLLYLTSVILLLMSVAYRWERARLLGMGVFAVSFTLHTAALAWRWYVSGRWPNSNMFEAVTTSVWLGTLAVLALEYAARRTPMRNLFALGGAAASMCALMAAHYVPQLNASINNMMPVLHDLWLYIHTNVIIASYALIAMAAVTALLYLVYRVGGGGAEYARVGGAATLMNISDSGMNEGVSLHRRQPSIGEVFDGATMVLMELSFVLLWAGIIMGAIWADHSWGRPWGWDPKEVFALNTFLVFLILVHVRLKVKDKGLWTALLAIAGCGVMLFNWIVINFIISGLHSYA